MYISELESRPIVVMATAVLSLVFNHKSACWRCSALPQALVLLKFTPLVCTAYSVGLHVYGNNCIAAGYCGLMYAVAREVCSVIKSARPDSESWKHGNRISIS